MVATIGYTPILVPGSHQMVQLILGVGTHDVEVDIESGDGATAHLTAVVDVAGVHVTPPPTSTDGTQPATSHSWSPYLVLLGLLCLGAALVDRIGLRRRGR